MASNHLAIKVIPMGLVIALSIAGSAIAQKRPTDIGTITVVAPRITYEVRRTGGSVVPKEITVAKRTALVSYADLNLNRTSDLYILEDRIDKAAAEICADLARELPDGEPNSAVCARRATEDAMAHVRRVTRQQVAARP